MPARRGLLESPEASCSLRFRLYGVADTEARADARPQRREVLAEGCFNSHDILAFKRQPCGRALAINVVRHPASCSCAPVRGAWGRAWGTQHSSALNWNLPGDSLDPALLGPFPSSAAGRDESGNIYATGPLRPGSGNGCIALTNRAFVVVTIGEAIATHRELPARMVNASRRSPTGRGGQVRIGRPKFQYETMSRALHLVRGRGLIFRHAAVRRPGR